jgi:ABC-type lipoprotein release transport system permease subunit
VSPERLNAFVFSGFAGIALLIAVVGVAGVMIAAAVLVGAAVVASLMPAARASRVDVLQALRSE